MSDVRYEVALDPEVFGEPRVISTIAGDSKVQVDTSDFLARMDMYRNMYLSSGLMTINEARGLIGLPSC